MENDDNNNNPDQDFSQCCRLCGELIEEGVRKIKKEKISAAVKNVYNETVAHDPGHFPKFVHRKCERKLLYSQQGAGRAAPDLFVFPIQQTPRCRRCGRRGGHNSPNCQRDQAATASARKLLMDCQTRHFANKRVEPFEAKVNEYCAETGGDKVDILKYTLQKELFAQGKRKEASYGYSI